MSLIKTIGSGLLTVFLTSCSAPVSWSSAKDNDVFAIKMTDRPGSYDFTRIERAIVEKVPEGFTDVSIFSNAQNHMAAQRVSDYFENTFSIKPHMQVIDDFADIQIQLARYRQAECYTSQLDDFNWYKSSATELHQYIQLAPCATNINDRNLRVYNES
ncbi:hypothetical protein HQN64_23885 [Enterobacteriaceae bacterium BIT-l23]|uniref:hypothetical protein n=1 Tax=Jejubacter sp. L23 TaxID=3092086 RepID=UPI0015857F9D|nr:hypothetical protein [Enterobacteriaceae bacterium BIT-l23]